MTLFRRITRPTYGGPRTGTTVPPPFKGRALKRRMVAFREASAFLPHLPKQEGEATHGLMSGRYDLMVLLAAILESWGSRCQHLRVATLSFNDRNTSELAHLLRPAGPVDRLTLLCSAFFRSNNREEFANARREAARFPGRWRMAAARSHAKVVTMEFGDGRRLVIEGSANLRTNSNHEQLTLIMERELAAWHSTWIDDTVSRHEHDPDAGDAAGGE